MNVMLDLRELALSIAARLEMAPISAMVLPPYAEAGQARNREFMALALESGAAGLSYVLIPAAGAEAYRSLQPQKFIGTQPELHAAKFGGSDPVENMIGLAAINAICQHAMRLDHMPLDQSSDSLGLMELQDGDRIGMVGLFRPLLKYLKKVDAELVVIEKNPALIDKVPGVRVTLDESALNHCNKVLCTSTAVLNNSLDHILAQCHQAQHITVLGPTAGFYPDPLFARGVDVVGSRFVIDAPLLLRRIEQGQRWGEATQKLCFQKSNYPVSQRVP